MGCRKGNVGFSFLTQELNARYEGGEYRGVANNTSPRISLSYCTTGQAGRSSTQSIVGLPPESHGRKSNYSSTRKDGVSEWAFGTAKSDH